MLLRENFRGRHERALEAVLRREPDGGGGDHRLAGADVALHEAVHRPSRRHIPRAVLRRALLRAGQRERERGIERGEGDAFAFLPRAGGAALAQQAQPQRQQEQLLEHQPPPRDLKRLVVRGEVDVFVGVADVAELVRLARVLGEEVGQVVGAGVEPLTDGFI